MGNYDNISGVRYNRYTEDSTPDDPACRDHNARIDELYFDYGRVTLRMDTKEGHLDIDIPILPMEKWDKFVASLPTWNGE